MGTLARKNYVRIILLVIALILTGLAISRLFWSVQTSYQAQLVGPPTATATATPTGAASPSASPAPSAAATQTTTSTNGTGSDTLILGLLGLAAFFALIAVYYSRISSLTFPGGAAISLNTADASQAVASRIRSRAETAASGGADPTSDPAAHLARLGTSSDHEGSKDVLDATDSAARQAGQATVSTIQKAEALLRLAEKNPYAFQALASAWNIPSDESMPVLAGHISIPLWERLADRSLDETDPAS
jgi:hypothetical protein